MAQELLTLKDIARQLNLAESTARYFRDKWPEYIPTVKVGRRTYYQPEAIEVLRVIAEETQKRNSAAETQSRLNALFAVNIEGKEESKRNNATEQQSREIANKEHYRMIAQANKEIYFLRGVIEQLLQDNRELTSKLLQLEAGKDRRPWYKRIFK